MFFSSLCTFTAYVRVATVVRSGYLGPRGCADDEGNDQPAEARTAYVNDTSDFMCTAFMWVI